LTKAGKIRRIARGLYDVPKTHPTLGTLSPDPDAIARAIAAQTGYRLQPTPARAANVLGLSSQIPAQVVYLIDGSSRKITVGNQIHAEGSLKAEIWVMDRTLQILSGEVGQVVKGIRQSITKRGLSGAKRKTLEAVADYLYRNRTRMRYHEYLANGWPIASGPVEGACKNLIKDRMERSGIRWTKQMAEAIVQLRAVYLSGDFESVLGIPHRTGSEATISGCLERRSKVAAP
jgi:hypothetical protein